MDYWISGSDSVDIKIYRSYNSEVEDYSLTPPGDYAAKSPHFEDCYSIVYNSTDKYIKKENGCKYLDKLVDFDPTASNYDMRVRDLALFPKMLLLSKFDFLKPERKTFKSLSDDYTNIEDTFTDYGYRLA